MLQASQIIAQDDSLDHEYLPITGLPEFTSAAARLILGADSPALKDGRVTSVQTISGTGANHLGALFLSRFYYQGATPQVFVSNPTWGELRRILWSKGSYLPFVHGANHHAIFRNVGIEPIDYPYYDPKTIGLDFSGLVDSLRNAPPRSVFLLHACAHNPTGVDPTPEQWKSIADMIIEKHHYAFFDCAYQGFASGDLDRDAYAVRYFVERGVPMLVCQVCTRLCVFGSANLGHTELCQECRLVWRASWSTACSISKQGYLRSSEESAFGTPAQRDQQSANMGRTSGEWRY